MPRYRLRYAARSTLVSTILDPDQLWSNVQTVWKCYQHMQNIPVGKEMLNSIYTRGVQYVMKTAQYIPKFYIYRLRNYFNLKVCFLAKYMSNSSCPAHYQIYTSQFQDRVLKYTAIWNKTMFSRADNYMKEGCFQSVSSCGKYTYNGDLYLQNVLILLHNLWYTEAVILVKTSLMVQFLAFHWQSRFCVNEYIAKIHTKIICNIFFLVASMFICK